MILKILGCGTSTGVPIPGCECAVCTSGKEKNERSRTSALLKLESGKNILIDCCTDLRYQALKHKIKKLDAVLLTHSHADHIMGLDDLRAFNFTLGGAMPCYTNEQTIQDLRRIFSYVFEPDPHYQGGLLPKVELNTIPELGTFNLCGVDITSFPLLHGSTRVLGFRFGDIAYATDCKEIPAESRQILNGVRRLVLDGLRYESHRTHMTISEAVQVATDLGVEKTYLTHMTHSVDYDEVMAKLPPHVELAYDGLEIGD